MYVFDCIITKRMLTRIIIPTYLDVLRVKNALNIDNLVFTAGNIGLPITYITSRNMTAVHVGIPI